MVSIKMRYVVTKVNDPYVRFHGRLIDETMIPCKWPTLQPRAPFKTADYSFNIVLTVDLVPGPHTVTVCSNSPEPYVWDWVVSAQDVEIGRGRVNCMTPLAIPFTVQEVPPYISVPAPPPAPPAAFKIEMPALCFPGFTIRKGLLCWVNILGVDLIIPPWDIVIWEPFCLWQAFTIFDSAWISAEVQKIISPILDPISAWLKDPLGPLHWLIAAITTPLNEALKDPQGPLVWLISAVTKPVEDWLKDPLGPLKWVSDEVGKAVAPVVKGIEDTLKPLIEGISTSINAALKDPLGPLAWLLTAIPKAVWDLFQSTADAMAKEYYERHSEEEKS